MQAIDSSQDLEMLCRACKLMTTHPLEPACAAFLKEGALLSLEELLSFDCIILVAGPCEAKERSHVCPPQVIAGYDAMWHARREACRPQDIVGRLA